MQAAWPVCLVGKVTSTCWDSASGNIQLQSPGNKPRALNLAALQFSSTCRQTAASITAPWCRNQRLKAAGSAPKPGGHCSGPAHEHGTFINKKMFPSLHSRRSLHYQRGQSPEVVSASRLASFPRLYDDGLPMTSYVLMWPYYFFLSTSYFLSTSSCSFSFFLRSLRLQLSSSFHTARRPPPLLFLLFLSFLSFYLPSYDDVLPYSSSTFLITTSYPPTCKYSYRHFNFIWRYNRFK